MRLSNTLSRYAPSAAIALGLALIATGALWYALGDGAAGQEPDPAIRPLDWPSFVATYETNTRPLSINGVRQMGREVRQIEWNSTYDWKVTVLSSPQLGRYDATGTYWQQRGNIYSHYDTWDDEPVVETEELPEHHYFLPPEGVFFPHLYSNDDFDIRTDGDLVILNVEYCDGPLTPCEASSPGSASSGARGLRASSNSSEPALLQGRWFEESSAVLSDDTNRIPLESGHLRVTKLHTNPPPTPTPVPLNGNPRTESVTGTTVTVSWGRLGSLPRPGSGTDYRVNYRQSASESWMFGNYVDTQTFSNHRPQATVPREGSLRCNTEYEFQVQVQILGQGDTWHDYGTLTARTGAC